MPNTTAAPYRTKATILQWLTIGHGLLEGGASLIASGMAGSVALMSFGLDSMVEVLSASIVLWRIVTMSRNAAFRISERSGLQMVGACFMILAFAVAFDASKALIGREHPHESLLGIAIAVFSVLAMPLLAKAKRK